MIAWLTAFSKHGIEVRAGIVKERFEDEGCNLSFGSGRLSVSRGCVDAGWYIPCLKYYVKEEDFIPDRPRL